MEREEVVTIAVVVDAASRMQVAELYPLDQRIRIAGGRLIRTRKHRLVKRGHLRDPAPHAAPDSSGSGHVSSG